MDVAIRELQECVRRYTNADELLRQAHHYDFAIRLRTRVDYWVLGLNPGESDLETERYPGTGHLNPQDPRNWDNLTPNAKRWIKKSKIVTRSDNLLLGDIFFWSSRNLDHFRDRYRSDIWNNVHLDFCIKMLWRLKIICPPKAVIVSGIGQASSVMEKFHLDFRGETADGRGKRLAVLYEDKAGTPWFVVRHFSRWFGNDATQSTAEYIATSLRH